MSRDTPSRPAPPRLTPYFGTFKQRALVLACALLALIGLGTVGLMLTEDVGAWYAFRWTLDTVATVGVFHPPRTTGGQVVGVLLIVLGVGTIFYAFATIVDFFVAGHLGELLAARRTQMSIDALSGHHIICGYGRVGRQVARDLLAAEAPCVVVDSQSDSVAAAQRAGVHAVEGDASDDAVLLQAGIVRARSVIVCADSDSDNVFITLTARELRADISIVARAAAEDAEKKLRRAGADRVISPYKASGSEMARLALHPQLSGTIDVDVDYRIEEITVSSGCAAEGRTVGELAQGLLIVGLRRGSTFESRPSDDTVTAAGDVVVALGTPVELARLESLMETSGTVGARAQSP